MRKGGQAGSPRRRRADEGRLLEMAREMRAMGLVKGDVDPEELLRRGRRLRPATDGFGHWRRGDVLRVKRLWAGAATIAEMEAEMRLPRDTILDMARDLALPGVDRRRRSPSREVADALRALWADRVTVEEIAARLDRSPREVATLARVLGLPPRRARPRRIAVPDALAARLRIAWAGPETLKEIAAATGLTVKSIRGHARRLGLPPRTPGRKPVPSADAAAAEIAPPSAPAAQAPVGREAVWTRDRLERLRVLEAEGLTDAEMSMRLDVTPASVRRGRRKLLRG